MLRRMRLPSYEDLDRYVVQYRAGIGSDVGASDPDWSQAAVVGYMWAHVEPASRREIRDTGDQYPEPRWVIWVRAEHDVRARDRLDVDGVVYSVIDVDHSLVRWGFLRLLCERVRHG